MTIKTEFIVNVGPYQHVAVTIEGVDIADFLVQLDSFKDTHMQDLGEFQAELESWVITSRQQAFEDVQADAVDTVKSLGATVVDEIPASVGEEMPGDAAVARPWQRKQEAKPKVWTPTKPAALDDF